MVQGRRRILLTLSLLPSINDLPAQLISTTLLHVRLHIIAWIANAAICITMCTCVFCFLLRCACCLASKPPKGHIVCMRGAAS